MTFTGPLWEDPPDFSDEDFERGSSDFEEPVKRNVMKKGKKKKHVRKNGKNTHVIGTQIVAFRGLLKAMLGLNFAKGRHFTPLVLLKKNIPGGTEYAGEPPYLTIDEDEEGITHPDDEEVLWLSTIDELKEDVIPESLKISRKFRDIAAAQQNMKWHIRRLINTVML